MLWKNNVFRGLVLIVSVSLFVSILGCEPKEAYVPPQNYDEMDIRMDKNIDAKKEEKNKSDENKTRNPWEDLKSLQESWYEDWGDTQKNLRKGVEYFRVELFDKAQEQFEKAIQYDPKFAPAYIELGKTFLEKNMPYAAEKALKDAAELDPSLPRSFYYLGVTYCRLWQIENNPEYKDLANKNVMFARDLKMDIPDPENIFDGDCIKPMELDFYTILIKSDPLGATAFLGDTELGQTPITIKTNLDKIHEVNGRKVGHYMLRRKVRFGEEQTATLTLEMKKTNETETVYETELPSPEGVILEHDAIFFDLNSDVIRPESHEVLDRIGKELMQFPEGQTSVDGHTCDLGSYEYNLDLSKRRAQAVADYLSEKFSIPKERFIINGYGEAKPITSNETDEGKRKNRRTEIIILK